ncbi:MAG: putative DNA-binding domain-containing protein [Sphingomonadales bacterium]|nr:putative DNA-binding domain-containing protein [Sphingomonadales bacterium]
MTCPPDAMAPEAMQAEVAALCAQARHGANTLYGALLRENILGAIACSFPEFSRKAGEMPLNAAVDLFVASHPAHLPQFHQIASEFVLFAQGGGVASARLPVMEYEWVLLDAEIDPAAVVLPDAGSVNELDLTLNPTLRLIMLPFDVTLPDWPALGDDHEARPHAVWRNAAHGVVTRVLSRTDCLMIDRLRQSGPLSCAALAWASAPDLPDDVPAWVHAALADDLLCLAHPKEAQS